MNTMHRSLALLWIPAFALACASAACNQGVYTTDSSGSGTDSDGETDSGADTDDGGEQVDVPDPNPNAGDPGDPQIILRIDDTPPKPIAIKVDKQTAKDLFGEGAKDITLIEIDSTVMLHNALSQIRDACGTSWGAGPNYNCNTESAQKLGVLGEKGPEFALVRLLTLTAANANMGGTELGELQQVVNLQPQFFPAGFSGILADALGVGETDPLLPVESLVDAAKRSLLASHPNIANEAGVLRVNLYDALYDMTPLQEPERFGPNGDHPGVLLPDSVDNEDGFVTKSDAITDEFAMRIETSTRHKRVDGVDLSAASGGDMFIVPADELGNPALAFNFDTVEIEGIAPNPTIDMRLRIHEHPGEDNNAPPIVPCTALPACEDNTPLAPVGDDTIWSQDKWNLEYLAALSGYIEYEEKKDSFEYFDCFTNGMDMNCSTWAVIGWPGNKPPEVPSVMKDGWTGFVVGWPLQPIPVPEPMYFWELLVGIADDLFHDLDNDGVYDLPLNPKPTFTFEQLSLGITADELVNGADLDGDGELDQLGVIDWLRTQEDTLSEIMVGNYWMNNAALDFYFMKEGEQTYLVFANEQDLRADPNDPSQVYAPDYPVPGFFDCRNLLESCKVSQTNIPGVTDTSREKLALPSGASTLYVRDDNGDDYELGVFKSAHGDEVWIDITKL